MSCQINVVASIGNVSFVRKLLFPEWEGEFRDSKGWDGDDPNWSWNEELVEDEKDESDSCSWLQRCVVSISPLGDVMVLARERTLALLNRKWDNGENGEVKAKYSLVCSDEVTDDKQDFVTSILCLPLASQKRSSRGRPDWTAVVVGLCSGNVKMLTEDGVLLVVQRFDYSPVINIKCSTFEPPRYNAMAEQHEEFVIFYKKAVVVVQGIGLYNMLRACRNQVAKASAMGGDVVDPPPLEYKKWTLHDHNEVSDCESVGTVSASVFDQMMHDSINRGYGGFLSGSRKIASASSLFVATGTCPYVGFYYAVESNAPPLVSEAMMAAAQKLSSYFTGFFRGAKSAPEKQPAKIEAGISLPNRFELRDLRRNGLGMCTSPNRRLTAVSDDFGRVMLIDNHEGIAVRIWKGYREAQCGWIEVDEDRYDEGTSGGTTSKPRVALFLVIYCRRRGILEVWAAQQGPRVAAFNVGKQATLIYCNHCILGLTDVKSVLHGWAQSSRCYLLESDGNVRTISIPFHCALSDKYSKRARDLHLLKKLKELMKSDYELSPTELAETVLDMKTASVRHQALDILLQSNDASFDQMNLTVSKLLASLEGHPIDSLDFESRLLLARCIRLLQLLNLHKGVETLRDDGEPMDVSDVDDEKPLQALSAILHLGEQDIDNLLKKVDRLLIVKGRRRGVHFKDSQVLSIGQFLSCFETNVSHIPRDHTATPLAISLIPHLPIERTVALSRLLFQASLCTENRSPHTLLTVLLESGVHQLLLLLIECWLSLDDVCNKWLSLYNLHAAVIFLASRSMDVDCVVADSNEVSPWWTTFRTRLTQSENTAAALTAAVVCRGAAVTLLAARQKQVLEEECSLNNKNDSTEDVPSKSCESISLSDWEGVDLDTEQWNLLVKQLEDLVFVSTLVKRSIQKSLMCEQGNGDTEMLPITVAGFMERGRGGISELVSQWLTMLDLPTLLHIFGLNEGVVVADGREKGKEMTTDSFMDNAEELKVELEKQTHHFPHSLQRDILLANCCWEFTIQWNKNKEVVEKLHCAIVCLKFMIGMPWSRGLASLLWQTFLMKPFAVAAQLTEKVGKTPKERLCRKDIGMSDTSLERFMQCCVDFLDVLSRMSSLPRDARSVCVFHCEDPWQNTTGPAPLVERAVSQKEPSYFLVSHHQRLALVLQMVFTFSLKCKPLSLYDAQSKSSFFVDLFSNSTFSKESPDFVIVNSRMQFLCRSISAVVQTIPEPFFSNSTTIPPPPTPASDYSLASCWMGKILELGAAWQLECDHLRRHYICELYSSGLDSLALEVVPSVVDSQVMGSQLILIAGQRIFNVLQSSGDTFVETISVFSPTVTAWLKTLKQDSLRCPSPPLPMIVSMITYILNVIPEQQAEHKMAFNLLEASQLLIGNDSRTDDGATSSDVVIS